MIIEDQPVLKSIQKLEETSRFQRLPVSDCVCNIVSGRERYSIENIPSDQDNDLSKIHELLVKTFSEKEVESEETFRVRAKSYKIYAVKSEDEEIACVFVGGHLRLDSESVLAIDYCTTSDKFKRRGLAREAYMSALKDTEKEATSWDKTLTIAIAECKFASEIFWNRIGLKRIYAQVDSKKSEYTEIPYMQPPQKFDHNTDNLALDSNGVAEHLMIARFGSTIIDKDRLIRIVNAFYREHYDEPISTFKGNLRAYSNFLKYLTRLENDFKYFLSNHGQLIFLDAQNRNKAISETAIPLAIHSYLKADIG